MTEEMKLFGKWSSKDIQVTDIGLERYINLEECLIPHSGGRHEHTRFHKSNIHIVERLVNRLMSPGRNTGKKLMALRIVEEAFVLIEMRTGKNPIQILVDAICNAAPREETTRISYGGIVYHTAVDSAPQRRVDFAVQLIVQAARRTSFNNVKRIEEILADNIILTANNDQNCYAIRRKLDIERVAMAAR
ncbi:MAG: 30S ribosomal protein S7 [Promethearchaeota archaeon]